jgi:hypothetical protein
MSQLLANEIKQIDYLAEISILTAVFNTDKPIRA